MKRFLVICMAAVAMLSSCKKDDDIEKTTLGISIAIPSDYSDAKVEGMPIKVKNLATGTTYDALANAQGKAEVVVESGTYQISVESTQTIASNVTSGTSHSDFTQEVTFRGLLENQVVAGSSLQVSLELSPSTPSAGFVIKTIYFAGTRTPLNESYWKDQYIEIYNNSDKVLYADGLSICEISFTTTTTPDEWKAVIPNDLVVSTVYTIPGSGQTVPVQPGKSIVIANIAINHKEQNANSFDLSAANYEWYDDNKLDVDVPNVPNLEKNFSTSATVWILHTRGYRGIILMQDTDMASYVAANKVSRPNASGSALVYGIKVPYNRIIDGVELSHPSAFMLKGLPASVDASYTYCSASYNGKCVQRKVEKRVNGRVVYRDTNNSAKDFDADQTPNPGVNI